MNDEGITLFYTQLCFISEMAERHDVPQLLVMARDLVHKVQILIENK